MLNDPECALLGTHSELVCHLLYTTRGMGSTGALWQRTHQQEGPQ
jgi:hypothetical protein